MVSTGHQTQLPSTDDLVDWIKLTFAGHDLQADCNAPPEYKIAVIVRHMTQHRRVVKLLAIKDDSTSSIHYFPWVEVLDMLI